MRFLRLFFCGLCMGSADLVPGISGGTIAFIMGFYEDLISSLRSLTLKSLSFLLPLVCGIATAFVLLAGFFHQILGDPTYRVYLYAAFFGLVVASFVYCAKQLEKWKWKHIAALAVGAVIAHLLTGTTLAPETHDETYSIKIGVQEHTIPLKNYDPNQQLLTGLTPSVLGALTAKGVVDHDTAIFDEAGERQGLVADVVQPFSGWGVDMWLVACGAVAITAMLLPGISGSYLLTLLGVYAVVIGALVDFVDGLKQLTFDQDAFLVLFSLAVGIVAGLALFVRCISWLLKNYHAMTIAALVGFMIGSLRSVWPFWSYEYMLDPLKLSKGPQLLPKETLWPDWSSPLVWTAIFFAIAGFILVFIIEFFAAREKKLGKNGEKSVS